MACNASKTPLLRHLSKRGFATAAQASAHAAKSSELQQTTLPNKLVVASQESNSPISRVSIVFKAGSRYESADNLGASHLLRIAAGLSTKNATNFAIVRNLQQVGGNLSCTSDRELVSYNVEVKRDQLEVALKYLEAAVTQQVFKPWEIKDNAHRVQEDIKRIPDAVKAIELLHEAIFNGGLGNSIFCPKHNVGKLSSESLQHFFANTCTTNRAAVAAVGIDHRELVGFAQSLHLESGAGVESSSSVVGPSEIRWNKGGRSATVAVGTTGAAWTNPKEALAFSILQYAAGAGSPVKRGASNGALTKQVANDSVAAKAINAVYSDNGVFGFVVSGEAKAVGKAVEAGVRALKSGSLTDDDVNRGKEQLKAAIAFASDSGASWVDSLGQQAALLGAAQDVKAAIAAVDAISASDVKSAARKVASQKVSVGAVGNLSNVPRLSQLS